MPLTFDNRVSKISSNVFAVATHATQIFDFIVDVCKFTSGLAPGICLIARAAFSFYDISDGRWRAH